MAISINKVSKELQEQIILDYQNNKSLREIEREYGVTRQTVSKFLERQGIKTERGNHHRTYFHDEDFFETIDTEEKAYWLGFMFADGYISDNTNRHGQDQFGISLAVDSIDSLKKFKKSIKATNPITFYEGRGTNEQVKGRLFFTSQKTVNDLIQKGCVKQKSFNTETTNWSSR